MKPNLIIEENNGFRQAFEFVVDENGDPIKLGDGSFGIVFKIQSKNEEYAYKAFYEDTVQHNLDALIISEKIIHSFQESKSVNFNNAKLQKLRKLIGMSLSLVELVNELKDLNLTNNETEILLPLILDESNSDINVKERYKYERDASLEVKNILKNLKDGSIDASHYKGVIDIITGTDKFKSSDAYKVFEKKFESDKIRISDFGIVMYLYKYTLKELLERKTDNYLININSSSLQELRISKEISTTEIQMVNKIFNSKDGLLKIIDSNQSLKKNKEELKKHIYNLNGYDLLSCMTYENRISTILPYLLYICQGLRALHLADKFHYDLKPANIFIRGGDMVEAAIGDLGYFIVPTLQGEERLRKSAHNILPLGTRHFRSPEQKDYFDVCDVEITNKGDLIIRDPKFIDTIIEEGDYVVFSKDAKQIKHYILAKTTDKNKTLPIHIVLDNKENGKLKMDAKTQALFYKEQDARTDYFGFGALIFDMLTGGKSPERFYDKIRSYDTKDASVSYLISKYEQVKGYQITEPKLLLLFSDFKDVENKVYAPKELVEIILRCMMYRVKDNYHNLFKNKKDNKVNSSSTGVKTPMGYVFNDLKTLKRKYPYLDYDNYLLNKTTPEFGQINHSTNLESKITILQKIQYDQLHSRLFHGIFYFKQLVKLVRSLISKNPDKQQYFSQLLPNNVIFTDGDTKLDFLFTAYKSKEKYISDLMDDLVYQKVTRDLVNPFVPNYLAFLRRKVEVSNIPNGKNKFKVTFFDSALLGDSIKVGDWILIEENLCKIKGVNNNIVELTSHLGEPIIVREKDSNKNNELHYLYYKNLDPCYYYLYMLGIYVYQIFFVGLGSSTKDKPILITLAQSARYLNNKEGQLRIRNMNSSFDKSKVKIRDVFNYIINIYLKLAFPEHKNSYYSDGQKDEDRIRSLNYEVNKLQELIEKVYRLPSTALDDFENTIDSKGFKKVLENQNLKKLEFDYLVKKNINFSVEGTTTGIIDFSVMLNKVQSLKEDFYKMIGSKASMF